MRRTVVGIAVCSAVALAGCQVSSSSRPSYQPAAPAVAPGGAPPPQPVTAGPPPPPDEGIRADPEASRSFLASISQPPMELVSTPVPPKVTALALENTARGEASGMVPSDPLKAALLMEGQRARTPISVAAGECVTFIAQGGLGVIEVDAFITAGAETILAEDPTSGPIAVIGGRGVCFRPPQPLSGELHVRVRRGGGIVIVQGYKR